MAVGQALTEKFIYGFYLGMMIISYFKPKPALFKGSCFKRRLVKMESNDISKRTVLVLLILTLVVSVVGTWTILSQPTTIYKTIENGGPQIGKVKLNIDSPSEPVMANAAGKVAIKIDG